MTKNRISFRSIFKMTAFVAFAMTAACAPQRPAGQANANLSGKNATGVIGGAPVEKALASDEFERKIFYLAIDVKKNGNTISWGSLCTASAISPRVILTAAHCVDGKTPEVLNILLTKNPVKSAMNLKEWYNVVAVRKNENYTGKDNHENDLALILLDRDLPANRISKLADPSRITTPMTLTVIGYGTISKSANAEEASLQASTLNYVQKTVADWSLNKTIFSINQNDHKGFCSGDSGGPGLVYDNVAQEYRILGVVSNVSMLHAQRDVLDPSRQYSLCIGQGNYMNVLHPVLNNWIVTNHNKLMEQKSGIPSLLSNL